MCRFAAYLGPALSLDALTTLPSHSIVKQSYQAREREEPLNGDGFGVAWFAPEVSDRPAAYRAVTPAWSDTNLLHLARVTRSECILAHVRAATPGLGVSPFNCHPFLGEGFAFMHNGYVAGFDRLKRPLLDTVDDARWYGVRGTTDSEVLFAIFRHAVARIDDQTEPHLRMLAGLRQVIARVSEASAARGVTDPHQLNLCVTDGRAMVVTRYQSHEPERAESLYVHEGRQYVCEGDLCRMVEPDEQGGAVLVASERLSDDEGWGRIPGNQAVVVSPERTIELRAL